MGTPETTAYIGVGANLGDRRGQCDRAVAALGGMPGVTVRRVSSWRETEAVGPPQGDFINGVVEVATTLSPRGLLEACLAVERAMGRQRHPGERRGPRVIDLDLLLFGDVVLDAPGLCVPHPELRARRFVLEPLAEIAPDAVDPVSGRTAARLLAELDAAPARAAGAAEPGTRP
jgi:2-amino-4-hydroxy-6-hydroxymethyldihydropteridine diphosphokinase